MSSVSSTLLTLSSSAMQVDERLAGVRVLHRDSEFRQRQAHPQLLGLAQRGRRRAHVAHLVHGRHQVGVGGHLAGLRPVGQMHRPLAGDAAPDHLGGQRQQRRGQPGGHLQHGVQGVDGVGILFPEPRTRPSHIPVRQRLGELPQLVAGAGDVADVQRRGEVVAQQRRAWPGCSGPARASNRCARCPSSAHTAPGTCRRSRTAAAPAGRPRGCPAR